MGTPLVQDSFHGNRWDYVYQMREGGKIKEQRRVILDFENELLKKVRGDVVAAGSDASKASESDAPIGTRVVTPLKKPVEKSLVDKLKFWQKNEAELSKQAAPIEATVKAKSAAEEATKKSAAIEAVVNEAPINKAPINEMLAPQVNDIAPPVAIETKSLLVVPVEAAPVEAPAVATPAAAPAAEVPQPAAAEVTQAVAPVSEPVREVVPAEAAAVLPAPAELAADVTPDAKEPYYQSESGMQFDRQLQFEVEPDEPAPMPTGPRTGNKIAPKPKELPQESDPSFFDRMLEKIGF
jgi:outer membrane protein assembly factor BamE